MVTVTMRGKDKQHSEKTLQVTDGAKYLDAEGKSANLTRFPARRQCVDY